MEKKIIYVLTYDPCNDCCHQIPKGVTDDLETAKAWQQQGSLNYYSFIEYVLNEIEEE